MLEIQYVLIHAIKTMYLRFQKRIITYFFYYSRMGKRNQDALKKLGLPGPSWLMPLFGAFPSIIKKVSID